MNRVIYDITGRPPFTIERKKRKPAPANIPAVSWVDHALEVFPDLPKNLLKTDSMHFYWYHLRERLDNAYRSQPPDDKCIRQIYMLAEWSIINLDSEFATQTFAAFYEHLPDPKYPAIRKDIARWINPDFFCQPAMIHFMKYHLGSDDAYEQFRAEYMDQYRQVSGKIGKGNEKSRKRSQPKR